MGITPGPGFARMATKFYRAAFATQEVIELDLIHAAARMASDTAKGNLDRLVYTAPLPRSAFPPWSTPSRYLRKPPRGRRSGAARRAVQIEEALLSTTARVFVSRSANTYGFYYPRILNFGGVRIKYEPRPFWTEMLSVMKAAFPILARKALEKIMAELR